MESNTSSLTIPTSSLATASSSVRNKVALKPGRSLMDWIRFSNSAKDLTSTGGKLLEVSSRELAKHNRVDDAWICLRGKVYNITHYLEYHPGGEDELMRGAGKDATDLFNQVHRWVNAESMLQKCLVGVLKKSWTIDVPRLPQIRPFKFKNKTPATESSNICNKGKNIESNKDTETKLLIKSQWTILSTSRSDLTEITVKFDDCEDSLKLEINNSHIRKQGLITDLIEKELYVKLNNSDSYFINIALPIPCTEYYKVAVEDGSKLEFILKKNIINVINHPSSNRSVKFLLCQPIQEYIYWSCKLISKIPINHNTILFTFLLPLGTKMWVPIGCHVQIKFNFEGTDVIRSYTPICSKLDQDLSLEDKIERSKIVFMIKIYPSGTLTPMINRCSLGDNLYISNYSGNFLEEFIESSDSIIMLAAGTGITPMIKIIMWVITDKDVKRSLQLLFFNKTEEDILWKNELEDCQSTYNDFQIDYILSEPSLKWNGYAGHVNEDILKQIIKVQTKFTNQRFLICGPRLFTEATLSCLKEAGYSPENIYTFLG